MKLTELAVAGFGALSDLELGQLSPGLNVFHGLNGSGKSTLLNFFRGMLFGFGDARRMGYLPPLHGEKTGGRLSCLFREEVLRLTRRGDDAIELVNRRGEALSEQLLRELQQVQPPLLNSLYCIGLKESHQLETLIQAARAAGVDFGDQPPEPSREFLAAELRVNQLREFFADRDPQNLIHSLQQQLARLQEELQSLERQQPKQQTTANTSRSSRANEPHDRELQRVRAELLRVNAELEAATRRGGSRQPVRSVVEYDWESYEQVTRKLQRLDADLDYLDHAEQLLQDLEQQHEELQQRLDEFPERQGTAVFSPNSAWNELEEELRQMQAELRRVSRSNDCDCRGVEDQLETLSSTLEDQYRSLRETHQQHEQYRLLMERKDNERCRHELEQYRDRIQSGREQLLESLKNCAVCRQLLQALEQPQAIHEPVLRDYLDRNLHELRTLIPDELRGLSASASPSTSSRSTVDTRGLEKQREQLRAELTRLEDQQQRATRREPENRDRRQLSPVQETRLRDLRHNLQQVEHDLQQARQHWTELTAAAEELTMFQEAQERNRRPSLLEDASESLVDLTEGEYEEISLHDGLSLVVRNDRGQHLPLEMLSRGTLDQVALSLRLAIAARLREMGVELPLVFDDILVDSDTHRSQRAVELLVHAAEEGQQILFLTCQQHLIHLFRQRGFPIRELPAVSTQSRRRPTVEQPPLSTYHQPQTDHSYTTTSSVSSSSRYAEPQESATIQFQPQAAQDQSEPELRQEPGPGLEGVDSPAALPSVTDSDARRLVELDIWQIDDLLNARPDETELYQAGIDPQDWQRWQAEADLLLRAPELAREDVEILAAAGIVSAGELAETDEDALLTRVYTYCRNSHLEQHRQRGRQYQRSHARGWQRAARNRRGSQPRSTETPRQPGNEWDRVEQRTEPEPRSSRREEPAESPHSAKELRFFLELDSPLEEAPSFGPKTARQFRKLKTKTVRDFLELDTAAAARQLNNRRMDADTLTRWQQQAALMCQVPEMRCHDVQFLVGCDITTPARLAACDPYQLLDDVTRYVSSSEGQSILRGGNAPDLDEVSTWIEHARQARQLRAA